MRTSETQHTVCIPIFPDATILDIVGPYQVFSAVPGIKQYLVAASAAPVRTDEGMTIFPDFDFDRCPPCDVLMVPGGPGQVGAMEDASYVEFLRRRGAQARYVTSVCVGRCCWRGRGCWTATAPPRTGRRSRAWRCSRR